MYSPNTLLSYQDLMELFQPYPFTIWGSTILYLYNQLYFDFPGNNIQAFIGTSSTSVTPPHKKESTPVWSRVKCGKKRSFQKSQCCITNELK